MAAAVSEAQRAKTARAPEQGTAAVAAAAAPTAAKATSTGAALRLGTKGTKPPSKLDPGQRERLEKLQSKYGQHVAQRVAGKAAPPE